MAMLCEELAGSSVLSIDDMTYQMPREKNYLAISRVETRRAA